MTSENRNGLRFQSGEFLPRKHRRSTSSAEMVKRGARCPKGVTRAGALWASEEQTEELLT
jgi:hypothetical protein